MSEHFEVVRVTTLPSGEQQATTIATVIETTIWDVRDNTVKVPGMTRPRIEDRAWVEVNEMPRYTPEVSE